MPLVHCYNKGCGNKFETENNPDDACQYHPGQPVFHDALKGWSCCNKRSTDFTEFLNIPGCTKGPHSNVKPPEPEKPPVDERLKDDVIVVEAPKVRDPKPAKVERPSSDEPMAKLKVTIGTSLKTALEKLKLTEETKEADSGAGDGDSQVKVGTSCKNKTCKATYQDESSNCEKCVHHPGEAIFHEGMKFWSCCMKKTSDFNNFLAQEGCKVGNHVWVLSEESRAQKKCRMDWYQTAPFVCLSVFAKVSVPEETLIEANRVTCKIKIVFEGGESTYENFLVLREPIIPEQSEVKMLGTKVEINLRKAEAYQWPTLELPKQEVSVADQEGQSTD